MRFNRSQMLAAFALMIALGSLFLRYPFNTKSSAPLPTDFLVYIKALERVNAHQNPYVEADTSPYKYSPGLLAVAQVLPAYPALAWMTFSSISLLGLAWIFFSALRKIPAKHALLLPLGLMISWKGILETLDYGQMELLILGLSVLAAEGVAKRPIAAGFLAGALPWIKLPWGFLIVPLILFPQSSRSRLLLTFGFFLSAFAWGILLPVSSFGISSSWDYTLAWIQLLKVQPQHLFTSGMNQSIWISSQRWVSPSGLALAAATCFVLFLFYRLFKALRSSEKQGSTALIWISPWLIFIQLINPLAWRWGSALLIGMPLALRKSSAVGLAISGALYLIQLNPVVKKLGYAHWSELHESGSITAFWLSLLINHLGLLKRLRPSHETASEKGHSLCEAD